MFIVVKAMVEDEVPGAILSEILVVKGKLLSHMMAK
jgi:hypothetical protein